MIDGLYLNLATILVVIVILLVFRQSDKKNRSLENIRSYYEKVQRELEDIVIEKKQELDDIKIKMQVYETTFREAFQGFDAGLKMIKGRDAELKNLSQKLDDYDNIINQLSDATAQADNNLSQLQEESRLLNAVSADIQSVRERMDGIEKQIDDVVAEFGKKNDVAFEALRIKVFNNIELKINSIKDEVQQAGERVALFNGKMEELTGRQNVVTDNACRKLESMLSERLGDMKEKVTQAADDYFQELGLVRERNSSMEENIIASLSHEMDVKVQGIRSCIDTCQQDINTRIEGLDKLKTEIWALEGKVQTLKEQGTGRLEDCMKIYEADAVRSLREKMDILTELTDGFKEKEQLLSDVQEKLDRLDRSMNWLARTETRLDEAVRKGEETVSILGGLGVKNVSPEHISEETAPTSVPEQEEPADVSVPAARGNEQDRTEMVKQLVQRGWNNRKISETLGISEGEVELIRDFNCGT